ncbi:MAG TPA: PDZ domain-containing protein [Candidatus Dormibacteraeota bacterium]|nr:PDZ domain-containing protein [Candidatus Dormibacteraeota bacterium]
MHHSSQRFQTFMSRVVLLAVLCPIGSTAAGARQGLQATVNASSPSPSTARGALGILMGRADAAHSGALIVSFSEDSLVPAAGIHRGDRIVSIDGVRVLAPQALVDAVLAHQPGDTVTLGVVTGRMPTRLITVKLIAANPFSAGECYYGGASFGIAGKEAPKFGLLVTTSAGNAVAAGLATGDFIVEVEGRKATLDWLGSLAGQRFPGDTVKVKFYDSNWKKRTTDLKLVCSVFDDEKWFQPLADQWRTTAQKPPLSQTAERYRVLAENAIGEKNASAALQYYEEGLAAFPWWPQGWYNAALIAGENHIYSAAAVYMKHYLMLEPNSPDAKDAREQIIIWEEKAKE